MLGAVARSVVSSAGAALWFCLHTAAGPGCGAGRSMAGPVLPDWLVFDRGREPSAGKLGRSPDLAERGDIQNLVITQA